MKCALLLAAVVAVALGAVVLAKSGDKNATGHLSKVVASHASTRAVGRTDGGSLWLGCTVEYNNGIEMDLDVKKVNGSFDTTFYYKLDPEGVREVIVALWRWKVDKGECAKNHGGQACEWCNKNGYHLEDRIARETASP